MKMIVKESTMVRAATHTLRQPLWSSNIDVVMPSAHGKCIYLYYNTSNGSPDFFDAKILKDSLSQALVLFYPMSGRLRKDKNGRLEIECNNAGVLFVEAESDGVIADFGDFTPTIKFSNKLLPVVDYSQGLSSYPLVVLQVTYFKCGGVSLGFSSEHHVADGTSAFHFINTWSEIARSLDPTVIPLMDRMHLRARDPPKTIFNHIEYQLPPPKKILCIETVPDDIDVSIFKFTRDQIDSLKTMSNCNKNVMRYTTFEILAGHLWRCVCRARDLPNGQETKLFITINGRSRLRPPLPQEYFGNVLFTATSTGLAGDLVSKPTQYITSKIHNALAKMDNDYLRSAVDYLEQRTIENPLFHNPTIEYPNLEHPNLEITSWARLGSHNADFGWGPPIYHGPAQITLEGECYMFPSLTNDGSFFVAMSLQKIHMESFRKICMHDIGISRLDLGSIT